MKQMPDRYDALTSRQRIEKALRGDCSDYVPTFDALRSKALIEYLAGAPLTQENGQTIILQALSAGFDATWNIKFPQLPHEIETTEGFVYEVQEWTTWIKKRPFTTPEECAKYMKLVIDKAETNSLDVRREVDQILAYQKGLGDCILALPVSTGFDYETFGLELFSYTYADYPEIVSAYLKVKNRIAIRHLTALVDAVADYEQFPLVMSGEDVACNSGLLFAPEFLRTHFIPYLECAVAVCHSKGLKYFYHSDGYLMEILPDMAAAGIDGLHPIEYHAGMRLRDIRIKHPNLILVGGIDAKGVLMFGAPADVRQFTRQAIKDASPGYLVGSSGAIYDPVSPENLQAMLDTAHEG